MRLSSCCFIGELFAIHRPHPLLSLSLSLVRCSSPEERTYRFSVFSDTVAAVLEHNNRGNESFTLGINPIADLTLAERLFRLTGAEIPDPSDIDSSSISGTIGARRLRSFRRDAAVKPASEAETVADDSAAAADFDADSHIDSSAGSARRLAIPSSVDWSTDATLVNPIKNQGSCGSCESLSDARSTACVVCPRSICLTPASAVYCSTSLSSVCVFECAPPLQAGLLAA